jgi:hypothetical protein
VSNTRYIVEGNLAVRETVTRSMAVPLDKMLESLTAYQPLDILPTPHNMRSISIKPRPNMQLQAQVIVGHDPMTRRVTHKMCPANSHRAPAKSYQLHFPYGLFWFALHGNKFSGVEGESIVWSPQGWGYVWMKEPFNNLEQHVWTPKMPNMFSDSRICFGYNSVNGSLPLGHFIDSSVNTFWTSEFNQDLEVPFPYDTMSEWEKAKPDDWRTWDMWNRDGSTAKDKFARFETDMQWDEPAPDNAGSQIPDLPHYPTFDNIETWLTGLEPERRDRIFATLETIRESDDI